MFDWLFKRKSKPGQQVKSVITLRHKDGEEVTIQVSGKTAEKVACVSNAIKERFKIGDSDCLHDEMKNLSRDMSSLFKDVSGLFKNTFGDIK